MLAITENFSFKILALFLAGFVWYLAKEKRSEQMTEMSFSVPIVYQNLPSNLQIIEESSSLVNITARGIGFNTNEVKAILDLENAIADNYTFPLTEQNIVAPQDVEVVRVTPSQLRVLVDQVIEKELQIVARYQGQVREGYILKSIELIPSMVKVRGPKSILSPIDSIFTNEIDLRDLNVSVDMVVERLFLPSESINFVENDPFTHTVKITIESIPTKVRLDDIAVYLKNPQFDYEINPRKFNIWLEGPTEMMNQLDKTQMFGVIDLENYIPAPNYQVHPKVELPEKIKILEQWPYISLWVKEREFSKPEATSFTQLYDSKGKAVNTLISRFSR